MRSRWARPCPVQAMARDRASLKTRLRLVRDAIAPGLFSRIGEKENAYAGRGPIGNQPALADNCDLFDVLTGAGGSAHAGFPTDASTVGGLSVGSPAAGPMPVRTLPGGGVLGGFQRSGSQSRRTSGEGVGSCANRSNRSRT